MGSCTTLLQRRTPTRPAHHQRLCCLAAAARSLATTHEASAKEREPLRQAQPELVLQREGRRHVVELGNGDAAFADGLGLREAHGVAASASGHGHATGRPEPADHSPPITLLPPVLGGVAAQSNGHIDAEWPYHELPLDRQVAAHQDPEDAPMPPQQWQQGQHQQYYHQLARGNPHAAASRRPVSHGEGLCAQQHAQLWSTAANEPAAEASSAGNGAAAQLPVQVPQDRSPQAEVGPRGVAHTGTQPQGQHHDHRQGQGQLDAAQVGQSPAGRVGSPDEAQGPPQFLDAASRSGGEASTSDRCATAGKDGGPGAGQARGGRRRSAACQPRGGSQHSGAAAAAVNQASAVGADTGLEAAAVSADPAHPSGGDGGVVGSAQGRGDKRSSTGRKRRGSRRGKSRAGPDGAAGGGGSGGNPEGGAKPPTRAAAADGASAPPQWYPDTDAEQSSTLSVPPEGHAPSAPVAAQRASRRLAHRGGGKGGEPRGAPRGPRPRGATRAEHAVLRWRAAMRQAALQPRKPTPADLRLTTSVMRATHWWEVLQLIRAHLERHEQERLNEEEKMRVEEERWLERRHGDAAAAEAASQAAAERGGAGVATAGGGDAGPRHAAEPRQRAAQRPGQPQPPGEPQPPAQPISPQPTSPQRHRARPQAMAGAKSGAPPTSPPPQPGAPPPALPAGYTADGPGPGPGSGPGPGPGLVPVASLPFTPQHVACMLFRTQQLLEAAGPPAHPVERRQLHGMLDGLARTAAKLLPSPGVGMREISTIAYSLVRLRYPVGTAYFMRLMVAAQRRLRAAHKEAERRRMAKEAKEAERRAMEAKKQRRRARRRDRKRRKRRGAAADPNRAAGAEADSAAAGADVMAASALPYTAIDLVQLLWSVSKCGVQRLRVDWAADYNAALLAVAAQLDGHNTSTVLYAMARLRAVPPQELLVALCGRLMELMGGGGGGGTTAEAEAAAEAAEGRIGGDSRFGGWPVVATLTRPFNPDCVSMSLWALATLRLPPAGYCPALLPAVERWSSSRLRDFQPQDLTILVWAMAKLQHAPGPDWARGVYGAVSYMLYDLQPLALSVLLYSLAQMRLRPPGEWLAEVLARAGEVLPDCSPQALSLIVHAVASMGHRPETAWLAAFHARLEAYPGQLDTRVRDKVREAYRILDFRPSEARSPLGAAGGRPPAAAAPAAARHAGPPALAPAPAPLRWEYGPAPAPGAAQGLRQRQIDAAGPEAEEADEDGLWWEPEPVREPRRVQGGAAADEAVPALVRPSRFSY